jgi:hypothetical protein
MKTNIKMLMAVAVAGGSLLGGVAFADTIGPLNCGSCEGASYTLTSDFVDLGASATTDTMNFTLTIDTSGVNAFNGVLDARLLDASIKVTSDLISGVLVSQPGGFIEVLGGLNANGCSGNGAGFDCAGGQNVGVATSGGPYTFVFQETFTTGTLLTGNLAASVKARYGSPTAGFLGLTSENITIQRPPSGVPEPASVILLGSGLVGIGLWGVKRRKNG